MSRESFFYLLSLIEDDPIFVSSATKRQRSPKHQLAAFLCRAGAEDGLKAASVTCIAEGTLYGYCYRVSKALRNIRDAHLAWPGPERREYLKEEMTAWGFPGCIGIGDGTLIRLTSKPRANGWVYWCRKKFYAVRIMIHTK